MRNEGRTEGAGASADAETGEDALKQSLAVTLEQLGTPPGAQPCIFIICGAHGYSPQEIPQAANLNSLN